MGFRCRMNAAASVRRTPFSLELVNHTTEDQFGIAPAMNCTCLSPRKIQPEGLEGFDLETVLFGEPRQFNILEVDVLEAKGIECLVDCLLGREDHGEAFSKIATLFALLGPIFRRRRSPDLRRTGPKRTGGMGAFQG